MARIGVRSAGALFALGLLFGGAISTPAPTEGITVYTRSASCAGLSFYPSDSRTTYDNIGPMRVVRAPREGGRDIFRCDPGLPNGATVTKVQFTLRFEGVSTNTWAGVEWCSLRRSGLVATATADQDMARIEPGLRTAAGPTRFTDSTIQNATIDNSKFGYWLECHLTHSAPWDYTGTNTAGIFGANVIYTISATNG